MTSKMTSKLGGKLGGGLKGKSMFANLIKKKSDSGPIAKSKKRELAPNLT